MANEVKVKITAQDNASKPLSDITSKLNDFGDNLSKAGINLTDLGNPMSLMVGMVGTLTDQFKEGVKFNVDYAKQVEDTSRKLGISAEESSKLIQVTDDLRIEYSTLEMAMRTALDKGIAPSIDSLEKLGAEYKALKTPVEKAQFAIDIFGSRAGLEMQKVLELSTGALTEMGQEVENTGLLMTEEGVKAANEYALSIDGLQDSWDGLRNTWVQDSIPKLKDINNALADEMNHLQETAVAQNRLNKLYQDGIITEKEYNRVVTELVGTGNDWSAALEYANSRLEEFNKTTDASDRTTARATAALKDNKDAHVKLTAALKDEMYNAKGLQLTEKEREALNKDLLQSTIDLLKAEEKQRQELEWQANAWQRMPTEIEKTLAGMNRIAGTDFRSVDFGLASNIEGELARIDVMMAGGGDFDEAFKKIKYLVDQNKITPEEAKAYYKDLAVGWEQTLVKAGQETATQAKQNLVDTLGITWEEATKLFNELPTAAQDVLDEVIFNLKVKAEVTSINWPMNTPTVKVNANLPEARAAGGPMYQGQRYVVGEAGYPETIVQGANGGYVYPTTNNYNLTINSQARSEQVQASFALMQALAR